MESWDESDAELRIRANVLVERESQKAIVLGKGGCRIRDLGQEARGRIGRMLQKRVHLNLWVKLDRNWSRRPRRARQLGYL